MELRAMHSIWVIDAVHGFVDLSVDHWTKFTSVRESLNIEKNIIINAVDEG